MMDWFDKNKRLRTLLSSRIALHLYFWGFFYLAYLAVVLMVFEQKSTGFSIIYSFFQIVLCTIPVYINFYALNKFLSKKQYFLYPLCLMALILVWAVLMWYFFVTFFNDKYSVYNYVFEIMWFIIVTTSIKYGKKSYEQKLEFQEINSKQLQTELSLLKTQINPHFLFNTLNNLFGLARKQDPKTADGIAQLSHLMRYMIYDSNADKIELEKEVQQIQRLIELQKLRFEKEDLCSWSPLSKTHLNTGLVCTSHHTLK
jgi:sensor histidine kinase YesM